jgi:hypothetical protein
MKTIPSAFTIVKVILTDSHGEGIFLTKKFIIFLII